MDNLNNYLNDFYKSNMLLDNLFILLFLYELFIFIIFIKIYLNTRSINNIVKEKKNPYNLRKRKTI
jgi:hypothetical protein